MTERDSENQRQVDPFYEAPGESGGQERLPGEGAVEGDSAGQVGVTIREPGPTAENIGTTIRESAPAGEDIGTTVRDMSHTLKESGTTVREPFPDSQ